MVKMTRGGGHGGRGRGKPRPLFPPGELPLFGPPPAFMRRGPPGPPPLPPRPPMRPFGDYGPPPPPHRLPLPPPPPMRPPHLGPPMHPIPHHPMTMRRRPGPPPPPMPLLGAPIMPPRGMPPFMRGRLMPRMGPRMGPMMGKKIGKNMKKGKPKKNKPKPSPAKTEGTPKTDGQKTENLLEGPWMTDELKAEVDKLKELQKSSEASKTESDVKLYTEAKGKIEALATAAKTAYLKTQTENQGDYFCEVCDRGWSSQEELDCHLREHARCPVEGCLYSAAPKLLSLHIKLQHETGVFERIIHSYNPEEVQKWKDERKKNYPTLENIEKKLAERKETGNRGGARPAPNSRPFQHGQGLALKNERRAGGDKGKGPTRKRKRKPALNQDKKPRFLSTASISEDMIVHENNSQNVVKDFSDDEQEDVGKVAKAPTPSVSGVLQALSTSYASDSEEENESEANTSATNQVCQQAEENNEEPDELEISRTADGIPNVHVEKAEKSSLKPPSSQGVAGSAERTTRPSGVARQTDLQWQRRLKKRPLTLLEKLLAEEIKQERNDILQCVRYIVQNNFFDDDFKKT